MAISGTITLGTDTTSNMTSFDLYPCTSSSNSSCSGTAFESNVSRETLIAGLQTNNIPDGTLYIKINAKNDGPCKDSNPAIIELSGAPIQISQSPTPTLTPTETPTQTPTQTPTSTRTVQITNCVRLVKSRPMRQTDCSLNFVQRVTVYLYDSNGANPQNATYDITVTLDGTDDGEPTTYDIVILPNESFGYIDVITDEQTSGDCENRDDTRVLRTVGTIVSISNPSINVCTTTLPPPEGTVLNGFYYGQGVSTSTGNCGTNYTINASFFATGSTITGLFNQTIYTNDLGSTAFNGSGLWWPVALETGTSTEFGNYNVIKINSNGSVEDIVFINSSCEAIPY
jgi:hypothetical protein